MDLRGSELRAAEFVAVDVETNGRAGEDCEITEVGAVLVGGGELHDELESLVRVERPLSRGIEIFTGITQSMVDAAPPAREALEPLARLLAGRALVAHSASFDRRGARPGLRGGRVHSPHPPPACPIALARPVSPPARHPRH